MYFVIYMYQHLLLLYIYPNINKLFVEITGTRVRYNNFILFYYIFGLFGVFFKHKLYI